MAKQAKKSNVGRPKGEKREPMNISLREKQASNLRIASVNKKQNISIIVEDALLAAGINYED